MMSNWRLLSQFIARGLKHDGEAVRHDIGVATTGPHGGGVAHEPLLRVGMTVVLLDTGDLKVGGTVQPIALR